jgi:hypothetical protein
VAAFLVKEKQMRTKIKVLAAGIIMALTLLVPFAQAASADVTRKTCENGGGYAGSTLCFGGKYHLERLMN